jgi:hypothetical protein
MKKQFLGWFLPLLMASSLAHAAKYSVKILSPQDMQPVPYRPCLVAAAHKDARNLVAIVHPTLWSNYHVQPAVSWVDQDRFHLTLYVGERGQDASGEIFEVQVYEDPKHLYHEGMILDAFPSLGAVSPIVRVVRNDQAPNGCDQALAVEPVGPSLGQTSSLLSSPNPSSPTPAASSKPAFLFITPGDRVALFLFGCIVLLLTIVLVRFPDRAAYAAECVGGSILDIVIWIGNLGVKLAESVAGLAGWLGPRTRSAAVASFKVHGYEGTLRKWGISFLVFPVLILASVMVFYADARMIQISLGLVFSAESSNPSPAHGGSFFGNLVPFEPSRADSMNPEATEASHRTFASRLVGIIDRTMDSFERLSEEPFGFAALGIAGLQGAFGIVMFFGINAMELVRLHPAQLLRERPLLTTLFLLLTLALAAMAAMRGYQLSPTDLNPWTPAILAGLISLALAPMMALCAHCAVECAGDQFTLVVFAALEGCIGLGLLTVPSWFVIALAIFLTCATAFLIYIAFAGLIWGYFKITSLYGDLMNSWKASPAGLRPIAAHALSILLVSVYLMAGGYLLLKGQI